MTQPAITLFTAQHPPEVLDYPHPDRRVTGAPERYTQTHFVSSRGDVTCGVWRCQPGAWKIKFAANKDEFFHVLQGRLRLHDEQGNVVQCGPGDSAVIPAGFAGMFEVLEPVVKHFVVVERNVTEQMQ